MRVELKESGFSCTFRASKPGVGQTFHKVRGTLTVSVPGDDPRKVPKPRTMTTARSSSYQPKEVHYLPMRVTVSMDCALHSSRNRPCFLATSVSISPDSTNRPCSRTQMTSALLV